MQVQKTWGTNSQPLDPAERWVPLAFRLVVYASLTYLLYEAAISFDSYMPGKEWAFGISTIRMFIFLPIHEAGHFIFRIFGTTMMILGGSFWQIALPLIWFIIAAKQRSHVAPFPLFWVGENMMDVSLYMRDAPVRLLPLFGGDKSGHDWFNLFSRWNIMGSADTFADVFYYGGFAVAVTGIVSGIVLAFIAFFTPRTVMPPAVPGLAPVAHAIEDILDESLERNHRKDSLEGPPP